MSFQHNRSRAIAADDHARIQIVHAAPAIVADALHAAAEDEHIAGVFLHGGVSGSNATLLAVREALAAVREGVRSVHIIDGGVESALLLEVLTNSGVGTALRSDQGPHFLADARSYFEGADAE